MSDKMSMSESERKTFDLHCQRRWPTNNKIYRRIYCLKGFYFTCGMVC